jgi:hypothetical protein
VNVQSLPLEQALQSNEMMKDEFLLHPPELSTQEVIFSKGPPLMV